MKRFRGSDGASAVPEPVVGRISPPPGPDSGPVVVLVGDHGADTAALEWAAAEAAARGSELRIVYAFRWPRLSDPIGNPTVDLRAREAAEAVLTEAERRARRVVPSLRIATRAFPGTEAAALVSAARMSRSQALVVLSHDGRSGHRELALTRRLARRTVASVAVIGLSGEEAVGPSAGRVVVGIDDNGGPPAALGFAFRAARRRGTGLTVVHATRSAMRGDGEDAVRIWQMAYPEVDVRWTISDGPVGGAVLAQSAAAAVTVLGSDRRGWLSRVLRKPASDVLRLARGPVVVVGSESL